VEVMLPEQKHASGCYDADNDDGGSW